MNRLFFLCICCTSILYSQSYKVTTIAGTGNAGDKDSIGKLASFHYPNGICRDKSGNLYVTDLHRIRKITPAGVVTTLVGSKFSGDIDGTGSSARFDGPNGICIDTAGNLIVVDGRNHKIKKVTPAGVVTTLAGGGYNNNGFRDSIGIHAFFAYPTDVCLDVDGSYLVADLGNNRIRKVTPGGVVTTYAGTGAQGNSNGIRSAATFDGPSGVCKDINNNTIISDWDNHLIRKISPSGVVTTLAGSGALGRSDGKGVSASFSSPARVTSDRYGNIFVTDVWLHNLRKIDTSGQVTTIAGSLIGYTDSIGLKSRFAYPFGVCVDSSGNLYIADENTCTIRKVSPCIGSSSSISHTACSGIAYFFLGKYLDKPGIYKDTIANASGCDSIITLNLSFVPISSSVSITICEGSNFIYNSKLRTTTGIYKDTLQAKVTFCDSIVTLNLTVLPKAASTINSSICQGRSYFFNGLNRSTTGLYLDTFRAANGCDSIVTLNLKVNPIASTSVNGSICQGGSYMFKGVELSSAGTYYDTLKTSDDCDSLITLNLAVNPLPNVAITKNGTKLQATSGFSSYKWFLNNNPISGSTNSITPSQSGTYSVEVTNSKSCKNKVSYSYSSISNVSTMLDFEVFPNPVYEQITINLLESAKYYKYELIDFLGKIVVSGTLISKNNLVNVSNLEAGLYYLRIRNTEGDIFFKRISIIK